MRVARHAGRWQRSGGALSSQDTGSKRVGMNGDANEFMLRLVTTLLTVMSETSPETIRLMRDSFVVQAETAEDNADRNMAEYAVDFMERVMGRSPG